MCYCQFCVIEDIKLTLSPFDLLIECDISNTDLELEVTAEGGIPPYEILWSDGTSANPISVGLSPGIQGVTITDNNNCSVDTTNALYTIIKVPSKTGKNAFNPGNGATCSDDLNNDGTTTTSDTVCPFDQVTLKI